MKNRWITGAIASSLALGCSDEHPNPDVEGCEHLQEGPAVAVTATAGAPAAPAVFADHQRYDITLVAVTGGMGGFVRYASPEATDFYFFLGADVPVRFLDPMNIDVTPEETVASSTVCSDIKGRHLVPLEVGTSSLQFGPTSQTSVSVVIEEAAHEH